MFKTKLIALAGAGVAAGALALSAAGTAGAVVTPVSVTVAPNNFSVVAGAAITPESVTVTLDSVLQNAQSHGHLALSVAATGLPAGVALNSAGTIISGTPTTAGNGVGVVTATAVETEPYVAYLLDLTNPDLPFDATNCTYQLIGASSFTVFQAPDGDGNGTLTVGITGLSLDPKTGVYSFTVVTTDSSSTSSDSDAGTTTQTGTYFNGKVTGVSVSSEELGVLVRHFESDYSVTKTCTGSATVTWAVSKVTTVPGPTVTVTPPPPSTPLSGVPSGGVQTGGGLPVSHSDQGLFVLLGSLALLIGAYPLARRWVKRQGS